MSQHLLEMREFMGVAGSNQPHSEAFEEPVIVIDDCSDMDLLIQDLESLRFKLENHQVLEGTHDFAMGYEQALARAAELLHRIIGQHKR